ncbi:Retrotransposon gag protein [Cucumis melo var. makuwa]|uniref:Retrotransposon gag protein n=1 Tax=Cucumis melo var. makuwa TaxID=1194695 RepID=A0A5A7UA44_CUCMM|nr:Retrotransposon gag protein [Cucumis melo var. makuwa]TYJ98079.1 Retrotransposon gag protein [Cucumis melo var. makuwa]
MPTHSTTDKRFNIKRLKALGATIFETTTYLADRDKWYCRGLVDSPYDESSSVQGDLTIFEYEKRFTFDKYALAFVINEANKCQQFEDGLQTEIRAPVMANTDCYGRNFQRQNKSQGSGNVPMYLEEVFQGRQIVGMNITQGNISQSVNQPYQSNGAGEGSSEIKVPKRSKSQRKVCTMTQNEVGMLISTPSGKVVIVEPVCRDCEITIKNVAIEVDLILFELDELDVIFGNGFPHLVSHDVRLLQ